MERTNGLKLKLGRTGVKNVCMELLKASQMGWQPETV